MISFLIIGVHFFSWGSQPAPNQMKCGKCGAVGTFIKEQGTRFITLFFIIPVLPISGIKDLLQCPVVGPGFKPSLKFHVVERINEQANWPTRTHCS
jgi:hypothetical protein